jgi:signal transduction histidine kinase
VGFSLNLIFNLSLLVAISVVSAIITDRFSRKAYSGPVLQGLLFGSAAVIGILFPVVLSPGVIFDGRSVVISLCSLFFGPVSGAIAAGMAIFTRVMVGGNGTMMGILVILSSGIIGVIFHYRWNKDFARIKYWKLYLIGIMVHVVMVALMFTLPWEAAINALKHFSLPVIGLYPLATVVIGKILKDNFVRIQTNEELLQQKELAEQSSRLKDIFIANVSHEIRTPLNAILGFVSIIEDEASDRFTDEERIYFKRIDQSGQRLTRTVDEILNYSRLLVKDLNLNITRINLPLLIETLISDAKMAHPNARVPIFFENNLGPITHDLDEFCIRNSLGNILDNALKYTESGNITVRLFLDEKEKESISVKDTGIGMSESFLNRIFEPYTQEATGYSRRYEGVGLGLSIVKRLCDIMKAEISVTSSKGHGSCFTITLPSPSPAPATHPVPAFSSKPKSS